MIDYTASPPKAYIYMLDVHGNVVALVNDTGNRIWNYEYNAWGQLTNTPETNVTTGNGELLRDANPFRYCGYQYDVETGLYYLKARYYTPGLGRFLTKEVHAGTTYTWFIPDHVDNPITEANRTYLRGGSIRRTS